MSELDLTNIAATSINTPASGVSALFLDSSGKVLSTKDDTGFVRAVRTNFSTAAQTPSATVRTYITGSNLAVGANKLQIGTIFRWKVSMTQTAAGIAASTFDICVGTAGTTADAARVSFTKPAGTAAIDEAWIDIIATLRGPLSGAGIMVGEFILNHNGNTAGHATTPTVILNTISSGFDVTVANLIVGLCITTGASDVITIQMVQSEMINQEIRDATD